MAPGDHPNPTWRQDATTSATTHERQETPAAAWALLVMAGVSLAPSLDTSWRFFGEKLGITGWERIAMFAVLEIMLVLSALSMSFNAKKTGHPGPARILVWAACGASAYMALLLAGPLVGWVRIALGPIMGLLALHFALGIQIRARKGAASTTWARIGRELRERMLSRLGLADDERDARTRTQDRAALRAAKLTLGKLVLFRAARVARLLRIAGIAHNPAIRNRMLAELAVLRHANDLANLQQPSPWLTHDNPPTELA
jgi:hypothetical protein